MPSNRISVTSDGGETFKGPGYRVDFHEAKELAQHWLIMGDLAFARLATKKLLELRAEGGLVEVLPRCLWTGAIEAYSRCFAGGRRYRLKKGEVFADQDGNLKMHEHLLTIRNHHTAHSINGLESAEAGIVIPDDGEWTVGVVAEIATAPPSEIVEELVQLTEIVWKWVQQKGAIQRQEMLRKAKDLGEEEIKKHPTIEVDIEEW